MDDVLLYNNILDNVLPSGFTDRYHVHILCRDGRMDFLLNGKYFFAEGGDLVIW